MPLAVAPRAVAAALGLAISPSIAAAGDPAGAAGAPQLRGVAPGAGVANVSSVVLATAAVPLYCQFLPAAMQPRDCWSAPARAQAPQGSQSSRCEDVAPGTVPACTYSQQEAVQFAYLSSAAYCDSSALQTWECGACQYVPGMADVRTYADASIDAYAFIGRLHGQCVLAFRGTSSMNGWMQDISSLATTDLPGCSHEGASCQVGQGFLQNYQALAGSIKEGLAAIGCSKSSPLAVTGHSLGAAMATLALFDLHGSGYNLTKAYNFGSPRVGDAAFARSFDSALAEVPVFRVTRADDPIVYLPAEGPFHHVATEVYYRGATTEGYRICDGSGEDPSCADQNPQGDVAGLLLQCAIPCSCGHLRYMEPAKHGSMSCACSSCR